MLKKLKEITGMEKIIAQTLSVMILMVGAYPVAYWLSGSVEIAVAATVFAAVGTFAVVALAFASAFAAVGTFAVVAAVATFAAFAVVVAVVPFTILAVTIAVASTVVGAVVVADTYKVKYWKALSLLLVEAGLLFTALTCCVPYVAIGLLAVSAIALTVILLRRRMSSTMVEAG